MAQYKGFNTEKNKLQQIWEQNKENSNSYDNLDIKDVKINTISFTKKNVITPIFNNIRVIQDVLEVSILLTNFTEDNIKSTKIFSFLDIEPGFLTLPRYQQNPSSILGLNKLNYIYIKKSETVYEVKIRHQTSVFDVENSVFVPVTVNCNFYFLNQHNYQNI
jgi:hypothetical protein